MLYYYIIYYIYMCVFSQGNNPVRLTENYHSAAVIVRLFKPAHCPRHRCTAGTTRVLQEHQLLL